ncbi:BnaAnng06880D [Brassica napus]|uniref:BnaAnng06880D protein n=1 Tax=Brassica napus TaxID=3708 RepID=A0A078I192_BRANA|nr:BnaAnng06880D [Brassica napus]
MGLTFRPVIFGLIGEKHFFNNKLYDVAYFTKKKHYSLAWFWFNRFCVKQSVKVLVICVLSLFFALSLSHSKTLKRDVKALNEIKASLGWRVVVVTELLLERSCFEMDLHNNKLTGPIPSQTKRLKRLKTCINLRWNKLQDLKRLTHLYLSFNSFKGETPKELAALPSDLAFVPFYLSEMLVTTNLVGTINICILQESSPPLSSIILGPFSSLYKISGPFRDCVPVLQQVHWKHSFCAISHIPKLTFPVSIYLDHNQFTGRIPDAFCKHPFLKEMYV